MLDQAMKQQLQTYLDNLKAPVSLRLSLDDSDKSVELDALAREIVTLSDKLTLDEHNNAGERAPAMSIVSEKNGTEITFAGLPMGHEFTSLVLALLHSGGHTIKLDDNVQQQIKDLDGEYNFEIYVSLSCQTCPDVVQALNMMAALNPGVKTVMIDGSLYQSEIDSRNIMAVPTVYLNGEQFSQGRIGLEDILARVDSKSVEKATAALSEKAPYDMLIVGGGPAGASAAIYAARKGLRTGIVVDKFGGQVLDTMGIENFISVKATEGPKLVSSLEEHVRQYDVDIMQGQLASEVHEKDVNGMIAVDLESGAKLTSKAVIVATGARWRNINVPGEEEYKGRGVAYCPHCDGPLFKGKKVAVVGGGNSGIEAAIDLAGIVEHVTVLEFASDLKADQVLINKANSMANIEIITDAQTSEITGDGSRVNGLTYKDRNSGEDHHVELAGVFVQIGLVPNSEFLKDTLEMNRFGEIEIGNKGETSMEGVFAAGDVTNVAFKQIIIAMGAGATASLGAFDYLIRSSQESESEAEAA